MRWVQWFRSNKTQVEVSVDAKAELLQLYAEIKAAKQEWDNAVRYFEYALGKDQIDYAIFAIEAAEKRYEMLLRKAKAMNVKWPEWYQGEAV
ncbi:YaaL family protein [Paenibacillus mendelii]|uniref:YaaL family protein n=1 Tax=Paenibacillus mendelii TaxID=206163 RepID=A0ABV6JKC3_9BACL|nr:YaaL family protein [Paenibacillus mendelii]MCQ6563936.1 YaaL family protein [Paenibacillus mendelii]